MTYTPWAFNGGPMPDEVVAVLDHNIFERLAAEFEEAHGVTIEEILSKPPWSFAEMEARLAPEIEAVLGQPDKKTIARKRTQAKKAPPKRG